MMLIRLGAVAGICAGAFAQSYWIEGATVIDGLGNPAKSVNVRVANGKIAAVGGSAAKAAGDTVIDARRLTLAPGFIDLHNHSDRGLANEPSATSQVSQGITTAVLGMDGGSPLPIGDWFARRKKAPAAINTLMFVGHASVRTKVTGADFRRKATDAEIAKMAALVDEAMRQGAVGLSSGLEYEVGSYSSTEEVIALAKVAAKYKGIYMSHIRDEADQSFEALNEVIRIAREAKIPAHISHIKLGTVNVWGKAKMAARLINDARGQGLDITADCYPYDAWSSTITVLIPNKKYEDPESVKKGLDDVGGPQNVTVTNCREHPDYEFKNLAEIAQMTGKTPVEVFIGIVRTGGAGVVGKTMKEEDMRVFYSMPWVMVASDGGIGMRHPRAAGTFPRVLGRYVREQHWLDLTEAIRKMTSAPAERLGLKDRGVIREGAAADLVLFDAEQVIDHSTFAKPAELATGISHVLVNGKLVWQGGKVSGELPGVTISRDEILSQQPR